MHHRDKVIGETFLVGTGVGTRIQDALIEIARQAEQVTNKKLFLAQHPHWTSCIRLKGETLSCIHHA